MSDNREWLTVGAEVALHTVGNVIGRRVMYATVTKVGKRDVVLQDQDRRERRVSVASLHEYGGSTWGPTTYLKPADDPTVTRDANRDMRKSVGYTVGRVLDEWRKTDDDEHAERAIKALQEALRRIEAAPTQPSTTRAEIRRAGTETEESA